MSLTLIIRICILALLLLTAHEINPRKLGQKGWKNLRFAMRHPIESLLHLRKNFHF